MGITYTCAHLLHIWCASQSGVYSIIIAPAFVNAHDKYMYNQICSILRQYSMQVSENN